MLSMLLFLARYVNIVFMLDAQLPASFQLNFTISQAFRIPEPVMLLRPCYGCPNHTGSAKYEWIQFMLAHKAELYLCDNFYAI
jgi:hypothetical protein